ncbi:TPA: hypothetical protein ACVOYS_004619 [Vibrio alginolyticus]|uniref:hypothetical protein n=1 Tax=Vibrio alginolyticus TaxID=663 RepID=UPI00148B3F19|nr:hypothetical protein [Vibrio alginolyticus]MCS0265498.1 hypothetical protein [Vibrio alginolyticus]NOH88748.1 hypothetical protein [Vibrio alginolyticus]
MEVSINDLSFKGQFTSDEEAKACLLKIAATSLQSKKLTGNMPVRRTKDLVSRPLVGDKTIKDFQIDLYSSNKPEDQKILGALLTNIVQGPFINSSELNEELKDFKSVCDETIEGSSIHAYLSKENESINALISAEHIEQYNNPLIKFELPNKKEITVLNFLADTCCNNYIRKYEANKKHLIKEDKVVAGKVHSKMDLSDSSAQECLDNGFQVLGNKYVYYFTNDQWYEFPQHTLGCYHGYPIGTPTNMVTVNRIKRVFGNPPYEATGYKFCTE